MSTAQSVSSQPAEVPVRADITAPTVAPIAAEDFHARASEALTLWLRWNSVYERVTAAMFDQRQNLQQLRETMDLADQLRQKAIALTQELTER